MIFSASLLGFALPDSQREIVDGAHPRARANSAFVIPRARRIVRMILCGSSSTLAARSNRFERSYHISRRTGKQDA
jgi:hypothetical protein